jgi:hypothetical protein
MTTITTVAQMLVRLCGVVLIILGLLFWTSNALLLIPVHILFGIVLVLSLWTLAILAARAGLPPALVAPAVVWGVIVLLLGLTQDQLLPGSAHVVIKVLHLLVGLGAIGLAERLARGIKGHLSMGRQAPRNQVSPAVQ